MYQRLFHEMMEAFALHEIVPDGEGNPEDFVFVDVNREFEKLTGVPRERLIGRTIRDAFPDIDESWLRRYGEVARSGEPVRAEAYSLPLRKHLELSAFRMEENRLGSLFIDITDRHRAVEALKQSESRSLRLIENLKRSESVLASLVDEKNALLKEVHHRVKNNLQVIASLMNIECGRFAGEGSVGEALVRMQDRVQSMAEVHDALYRSASLSAADLGIAVRSMVDRLSDTYDALSRGISVAVEAGELLLPLDLAVPCCLALNELLTNALKHAFPPEWGGPREISLAIDITGAGRVSAVVSDTGIGLPAIPGGADPASSEDAGGLHLARLLCEQLDGEFLLRAENGTEAGMTFPLP